MLISIIVLGVIVFFLMFELPNLMLCGWPKTDGKILELLETLRNNKPYTDDKEYYDSIESFYKTKIVDETMIYTFRQPYISKSLSCLLFKWYIDGYGVVPRWYKSHSEINKLYNELKDK